MYGVFCLDLAYIYIGYRYTVYGIYTHIYLDIYIYIFLTRSIWDCSGGIERCFLLGVEEGSVRGRRLWQMICTAFDRM